MIKHIVLFKVKDFSDEEEKIATAKKIADSIQNLNASIKEIKFMETGVTIAPGSQYDVSLISEFETIKDLETYRNHPEHVKVLELIKETTSSRVAVDYEI